MGLQKFSNNAQGTTTGAVSLGATTFTLQTGEGAEFPTIGTNAYCWVRLGTDSLNEVVKVTARSGDVFTCAATLAAWGAGTLVSLCVSKEMLDDFVQNNVIDVYAMAIARMRGASSSSSGVFLATMDITLEDDLKVVAQASPNMSVKVKAGACIVLGKFTGISIDVDVAIAAPTTNNRITILQISKTGVVSAKHGTEAGSPVAPSVDTDNYKLGQVLLGTSATDIENSDCTDSRNAI